MRFRFIDRVLSFERGERSRLVIAKAFTDCDELAAGFPQRPGEVPNCLILESLANAGVYLVYRHSGERVAGVLLRVQEATISAPVQAGEEIVVRTELLGMQPSAEDSVGVAQTVGSAFAGDRKVAQARLVLLCFPKDGFEAALPW